MSAGGIALASLSAYLAGKFTNTIILSRIKILMNGRALWVRVIASSLAGHLLDTLVFVSVASLTGVFAWEIFATLVLTNYLFKFSIGTMLFPLAFLVIKKIKKAEGSDAYDVGVSFNPFSWRKYG
ncbi:MAG: queuosine precursor transporter [Treponema sp.]|nr:queuosine precursor transporter [Treponema sp.]